MLFHITLTHSQEDCPGRRSDEIPELIGPAERLEALGNELSVTAHSVVWGASCILWAEPRHVAYALLEAANLEAVERYIDALTPTGWTKQTLPVFMLPSQLATVRDILATPAIPLVQPPAPVAEPVAEPVDDRDTADTLEGLTVEPEPTVEEVPSTVEPPEEPLDKRPTRAIPQPVVPPEQPPVPDSGAVTRFVDRHTVLESLASSDLQPEPVADDIEPYAPSESATVILEPKVQRAAGIRLVANSGPAQGSVFDVGETGATLGRLPENSICLTDGRLSRHHARIDFRDNGYWLSDLGSQNGTLVNDHPLTEAHRLQAGDSIELGTTRMTVMLDADSD
jgi:hypothetical protein